METQQTTPMTNEPAIVTPSSTIDYSALPYAGFWRRFVAIIIDGIILSIALDILLSIISVHSNSGMNMSYHMGYGYSHHYYSNYSSYSGDFWIRLAISWLYFSLMESSVWQATLGKRILGIKVTDYNGMRISFLNATGRYFSKFISAIILFIGFIMAGLTARKQALHDMIAKTLVVISPKK